MEEIHHLLHACEEGSTAEVQAILDKGLDVNATNDDGTTGLQVAAANAQEPVVRLLLMRGAALDQSNTFGWTPLLLAARYGHVNMVALLLQNKADLNARTRLGASAVTLASRGGHLQTCKLLIEAGIDLSASTGVGGTSCEFTPLMVAAHQGHDAVVRLLLDRGCDVNYRTPSMGINSLMFAALSDHVTTSQILIERGGDPNLTNVNEYTPLQVATHCSNREVMGYLDRKTVNKPKRAPEDFKPDIIEAAKQGDLTRIREVLEDDVSQRDANSPQDGATPLMFAAMTGRLDIAQALVEKGCDINKQDCVSGWTALMQATYHGKKTVAKYLINAGADVLIPARNGCTAFDMASLIEDMDTELYRVMAAKAVQISKSDKKGRTWSPKQNGTMTLPAGTLSEQSMAAEPQATQQPKTGLKVWWNRMSNRFRNLKLGRTFNMNNNRLAPMPTAKSSNDLTLKANASPKTEQAKPKKSLSVDPLSSMSTANLTTIMSYETMLMETKKNASMYTLAASNLPSAAWGMQDGTLRAVIPPFKPPPTFETDRPKMPPTAARRSVGSMANSSTLTQTSTRPILPPMKLLQSYSASTQNLASSPSAASKFPQNHHSSTHHNTLPHSHTSHHHHHHHHHHSPHPHPPPQQSDDTSPSSSAGASALTNSTSGKSRGPSSASSSTLTAGSDTLNRSGHLGSREMLFSPVHRNPLSRPSHYLATSHMASNRPSKASSSGSSGSARKKNSRGTKSGYSSKDSASTLTPSPSPTPPKVAESPGETESLESSSNERNSVDPEDDLGGILKKLSLEMYQPIFEEQEVDMEAFLTLTDKDLTELGISRHEPRHQILKTINELNSGKGRERQHFQETLTSFQSTLRSRSEFTSDGLESSQWSLNAEEAAPHETSNKSRSS